MKNVFETNQARLYVNGWKVKGNQRENDWSEDGRAAIIAIWRGIRYTGLWAHQNMYH